MLYLVSAIDSKVQNKAIPVDAGILQSLALRAE
jgi:hypothetical protein